MVNLGVATDLPIVVRSIAVTETVTVTASTSEVFSSTRTGAATTVVLEQIVGIRVQSERGVLEIELPRRLKHPPVKIQVLSSASRN